MTLPTDKLWTFLGPSAGGNCMSVTPDINTANKVWVVTDFSGVFKSTDNGDNWDWSHSSALYNISGKVVIQSASTPTTMYYYSGKSTSSASRIHSSTDSGVTWADHGYINPGTAYASGSNEQIRNLAVNRTDGNTAYVGLWGASGASGNIFRTTNRTTWSEWKTGSQVTNSGSVIGPIHCAVVDMSNTYLWVGGPTGLRRITLADGTVTNYTLTGTNNPTFNVCIVACTIAGTNYVFVSSGNKIAYSTTNSFTSPTYLTDSSLTTSAYKIKRFDVAPGASLGATKLLVYWQDTSLWYNGQLRKSSDGGSTWASGEGSFTPDSTNIPSRTWHGREVLRYSVTADPNNTNRWWVSGLWGVERTDDFGVTWADKAKGIGIQFMTDMTLAPDNSIYATSMDNGLIRSIDDGATWLQCVPNASQNGSSSNGHSWKVVCLGSSADWAASQGVVVVSGSCWDTSQNQNILWRSTNQGPTGTGTWTKITGGAIPNNRFTSGLYFGSPNGQGNITAMCVDPNATSKTTGKIWLGLNGYLGTNYGGIFQSTDAGATWTRKTPTTTPADWSVNGAIAVNPTNSLNILYGTFGSGGSGIRRSNDGGTSWAEAVTTGIDNIREIKFGSDGTAYAAGDSSGPVLYRSTDSGANWTAIWHGAPTTGPADGLAIDPNDPDRLIVTIDTYGDGKTNANPIWISENCRDATPTFTDVTGDLPIGIGAAAAMWRMSEGTAGYIYIGRDGMSISKMNLADAVGTLTSTNIQPASLILNTANTVTITFTTVNSVANDGKIVCTFPTSLGGGFTFDSGGASTASFNSGGDGSLAVSIVSNVVTLTRSGGSTIAASTAVSIALTNVLNPNQSGSTGTYEIKTTTSADATIDNDTAVSADTIIAPATYTTLTIKGLTLSQMKWNA